MGGERTRPDPRIEEASSVCVSVVTPDYYQHGNGAGDGVMGFKARECYGERSLLDHAG